MSRGVHASVLRKPKARLVQWLHLHCRFNRPPTRQSGAFRDQHLHGAARRDRRTQSYRADPRARAGAAGPAIALGIGDDAAIVEPPRGTRIVVTTDALVEDVHFRRRFMAPAIIGYKALAISLSDLAAMGAPPLASFLSLALPADFSIEDF